MRTVLLTGGAGYIGSHTAVELIKAGYRVVAVDNLINSSEESLRRVSKICDAEISFRKADVSDTQALDRVFKEFDIDGVVHFAGLKAVGESVEKPLLYYRNNIDATISLLEAMLMNRVNTLIFSSSATVYDTSCAPVYTEATPLKPCNPYGWTKFMCEQIIRDVCAANKELSAINLRYFNPVGAHESGLIGEAPSGIPNNLMPYITQVAVGRRAGLTVFGDDYDTHDGTGVRDYIHVVDLAKGHCLALKYAFDNKGALDINLGTGRGFSVLDMVKAFEKVNGVKIPYRIGPRRAGDIAAYWADPDRAERLLGWKAELDIEDMCRDAWRWQSRNPRGYME
jgi:UDP-glucose 4-epimerase